jgi:hypothetical protein
MDINERFGNIPDVPFDIGAPLPTRASQKALLARHRARQRALKRKPRKQAEHHGLAYAVFVFWFLALAGMLLLNTGSAPITAGW